MDMDSVLPKVTLEIPMPICQPPRPQNSAPLLRQLKRCEEALRMIRRISGNALVLRIAIDALEGKDNSDV